MKTEQILSDAEPATSVPQWFNSHGFKMSILEYEREQSTLHIGSGVAKLIISLVSSKDMIRVEWQIIEDDQADVKGCRRFTGEELKTAFCLSVTDCTLQGKFIRHGNFLNIPCAGTGQDGDPNISLYIDDEI